MLWCCSDRFAAFERETFGRKHCFCFCVFTRCPNQREISSLSLKPSPSSQLTVHKVSGWMLSLRLYHLFYSRLRWNGSESQRSRDICLPPGFSFVCRSVYCLKSINNGWISQIFLSLEVKKWMVWQLKVLSLSSNSHSAVFSDTTIL